MPTVVNKIVESFPHPVVTPIFGMLKYNTLFDRIYDISSNVALIQKRLVSSKHSFLALTVSLTVYATLSVTSFTKPANLGPAPSVPKNSTGIKQTAIWYKFTLDTELYSLLQNMDKALKQQLLDSVEDIYLRALREKYIGYKNITFLEVINHLKANYYNITSANLNINTARMNVPHNINELSESIIEQNLVEVLK